MSRELFGRIITDDQVEDAVVGVLRRWLPTYLSEVERQVDLAAGFYQRPEYGAYTVRADFDKFPEEMLPLVVIVSPGILDDPPKRGRYQTYAAVFQINVTCIVSSTDQISTRRYAYRMGAAIRTALIQHQSLEQALESSVQGIDWVAERNNELPSGEGDRTIWANRQAFLIGVDDVMSKLAGPGVIDPPTDPTQDYPDPSTVTSADATLVEESIT